MHVGRQQQQSLIDSKSDGSGNGDIQQRIQHRDEQRQPHSLNKGNWQEELALQSSTGYSRSSAPKTPAYYKNHDRVMHHTDNIASKDYQSTSDVGQYYAKKGLEFNVVGGGLGGRGEKVQSIGPAQRKREALALAAAKDEFNSNKKSREVKALEVDYRSLGKASYVEHPAEARMNDNGHGRHTHDASRFKGSDAAPRNLPEGDYTNAQAMTFWSQQLKNDDPVASFPMTAGGHVGGVNGRPFERSSAFSNDIRDSTKHHSEGIDVFGGRAVNVLNGGYSGGEGEGRDADDRWMNGSNVGIHTIDSGGLGVDRREMRDNMFEQFEENKS
jgi:hypothetical protein